MKTQGNMTKARREAAAIGASDGERDFARREVYDRPQLAWPLAVSEYRLSEEAGVRMCLVRFVYKEPITVDELTLTVTMLDGGGAEIDRLDVTFCDSDIPREAEKTGMIPLQGIPVDRRCAEVILDIRRIVSGNYRYRAVGSRVVPDYCPPAPWRYDAQAGTRAGLSDVRPLRVRSGRARRVRGLWPMAVLGLILLLLGLLLPLLTVRPDRSRNNWQNGSIQSPYKAAVCERTMSGRL